MTGYDSNGMCYECGGKAGEHGPTCSYGSKLVASKVSIDLDHERRFGTTPEPQQQSRETFDFATAEQKLRSGVTVKRLAWAGDAILCLCKNYVMVSREVPDSYVQLLDRGRGAFWDITPDDRRASDWVVCN